MEDFFRVGVITNSHGIRGEVKVYPTTEDVRRYDYLEEAFIDAGKEKIKVTVSSVKYFKNMVIVKFKEYNNINDILAYKGMDLLVSRENAIPLEDGLCYVADLIGCNVITDEGNTLGVLTDVIETGANAVYIVKMEDGKEVLLPVIDECVLEKDVENKIVKVHVMKGLLD